MLRVYGFGGCGVPCQTGLHTRSETGVDMQRTLYIEGQGREHAAGARHVVSGVVAAGDAFPVDEAWPEPRVTGPKSFVTLCLCNKDPFGPKRGGTPWKGPLILFPTNPKP